MMSFILQITPTVAGAIADTAAAIQPAVTGIQTATELPPNEISLFEMVAKGGVIMIPLAILLLMSLYVMVERFLTISKASKKNATLLASVKDMINSGNLANARNMCKSVNTPEAIMLEQGISRIGQSMQEIREAMDKAGSSELNRLEKNMSILNITGRIAPMFGFIGTIIGVIKIFYDISVAKTVEIEVISSGLYQKMITSCGGLVVGVLAFVFYHWLNARIDKLAHRMEETQIAFLDMLNEPSK
ncbi:MAG: MotA/TolQ/ExbB proton channel family protein [Bacteroidetes bacterium]|jgi:biopolymer transport protein ExbB|nr:MotA/TolQ/ExbB proton channel family protein [Bacteroidota bacterium]MBK8366912.1 MotA/TolQ/ExbB proton channel family protein [Bacteroidota bacterium]